MYKKTKAWHRLRNFPPNSTNLLLHVQRVSNEIIVMERHLTLNLTSDHINNVRSEFLRSDLYKKDGVAHESNFIIKKVMIRHLLGRPCWILTNYKRSQKRPAGQLCGSAHPISSLWSISYYVICITIENRIFRDER